MKATIIRPDGTRIEVEGTPEEIKLVVSPAAQFVPCTLQHYPTLTPSLNPWITYMTAGTKTIIPTTLDAAIY